MIEKRYRFHKKGRRWKAKGKKGGHCWTCCKWDKKIKQKNGDYKNKEIKEVKNNGEKEKVNLL